MNNFISKCSTDESSGRFVREERNYGDDLPKALSLAQAAKYLGISKSHLANIIRGQVEGVPTLRHAKVGRRLLFRVTWLEEWVEKIGQRSVLSKWSQPIRD